MSSWTPLCKVHLRMWVLAPMQDALCPQILGHVAIARGESQPKQATQTMSKNEQT